MKKVETYIYANEDIKKQKIIDEEKKLLKR